MSESTLRNVPQEKEIHALPGLVMLPVLLLLLAASIILIVLGASNEIVFLAVIGIIGLILSLILLLPGFKMIAPNEAAVYTLFGQYYGTLKKPGFYFVNPFVVSNAPVIKPVQTTTVNGTAVQLSSGSKKISLKTRTLDNSKQKVNDAMGNPIIIGSVVIWHVENPTTAVFSVENYEEYLSIQCDSTIRNTARLYPYDSMEDESEEKTLRGSSQEISELMQQELAERVADAGLVIEDVRITTLAYSEEIAASMLQRQQATAVIAARQKIVEGAVGMVKMAIDQLSEDEVVVLDEERKAAMVSNLLVVLCGNKDAQPIVNSGSIY